MSIRWDLSCKECGDLRREYHEIADILTTAANDLATALQAADDLSISNGLMVINLMQCRQLECKTRIGRHEAESHTPSCVAGLS